MEKIYFATTNERKVNSLKKVLKDHDIDVRHANFNLLEPRSEDLRVIANAKITQAIRLFKEGERVIVHDASFYIHTLGGWPGPYINFVLENPKFGISGILKLAEGEPRECEFRTCLAYFDWNADLGQPMYFESVIKGSLSFSPREVNNKEGWSELHRIFIPEGETKTLSEMTTEEYNAFRYKEHSSSESYVNKFAEWFKKYSAGRNP